MLYIWVVLSLCFYSIHPMSTSPLLYSLSMYLLLRSLQLVFVTVLTLYTSCFPVSKWGWVFKKMWATAFSFHCVHQFPPFICAALPSEHVLNGTVMFQLVAVDGKLIICPPYSVSHVVHIFGVGTLPLRHYCNTVRWRSLCCRLFKVHQSHRDCFNVSTFICSAYRANNLFDLA